MSGEFENYRYEKKFIINNSYNFLINHYVKSNKLLFKKHFEERTINTIYFDNNLELYYQNINGLKNRRKIRIRWYCDESEFLSPILEIKIKNGNLGEKKRFQLNQINKTKGKVVLKDILNSLLETQYKRELKELFYFYKPNLFITYEREYFLSKFSNCRLTIDKNIKYHKISCDKISNFSRKYGKNLIEIKYPSTLDNEILNGILDFPFRISRHSKYVEGINLIY